MRVLNVTAQKPDSTGSGTYLAQTVRCELALGHEAAVVCGVADGDATPALPEGLPVYPVRFDTPELPFHVPGMSDSMPYPATRYRDMTPWMAARFKEAFARAVGQAGEEFAPDVVVCHHLYIVTAVARRALPGVRMAGVSHSTDLRQLAKHGLERDFVMGGVRRLDRVLALHEAQRREIEGLFGLTPGTAAVVGAGYDDALFNMRCRAQPARPGAAQGGRILYVGKICRKKGVPSLIRAYGMLPCRVGPTELVLAGGANDPEELAEARELAAACPRPVRLVGKLAPAELAPLYRESDVLALPSFFEGLPLVVVEALACGCKAVVTDLPGLRPWLEANAPGAPVSYVALPRMTDIDTPVEEDLPEFERRLARGLAEALDAPWRPCDLSGSTWKAVTERILEAVSGPAAS